MQKKDLIATYSVNVQSKYPYSKKHCGGETGVYWKTEAQIECYKRDVDFTVSYALSALKIITTFR